MTDVLGILVPFSTAVLIILIVFVAKVIRDKSRNQVVMKALENGKELPAEFFQPTEKKREKERDPLRDSLVTLGLGIGITAALYFLLGIKYAAFGFIPLFIGVGQLTAYVINRNRKE
ncbi:MAG: DUF6249 domain-containing protein [Bacteroidales bacterium]|nr:DUF6249 domain-containing protein [Bacteroidales bacterium]MDD2425681.1 DUF6249 domain-containing protein [Bacteroidales bacterium]MDD3989702.1 DUF6249 domain-containing protein [Bacteroidales bacterium]MDD4638245.1 DUF6249 domain-containing protein [Bacteroidales bacterium]